MTNFIYSVTNHRFYFNFVLIYREVTIIIETHTHNCMVTDSNLSECVQPNNIDKCS